MQPPANLPDLLLPRLRAHGTAAAQVESESGRAVSFLSLSRGVERQARGLGAAGLGPGAVLGLCLQNQLGYAELLLAGLQLGAVVSLYPPAATRRELEHLLSVTRPSLVVGLTESQREVLASFPGTRAWTPPPACSTPDQPTPPPACPATPDQPALLLASSGSTGLPKAVLLPHSSLIASLLSLSALLMEKGKPALGLMPFYHAYGMGLMLMALFQGSPFVIMNKFNLKDFTTTISKYKISHLHIVPSLLVKLSGDEVSGESLREVEKVFTGAGAVSPKVQAAVLAKLSPGAKVYHSYGMTETTHIVALGVASQDKPGSSGRIIPCMKAKITGSNGEELGPEERGELHLQGPLLATGYLHNPEATRENFTPDGWLKTGDLAFLDRDGYLFIVDRIKDIIKYQGYQISVTELEQVIIEQKGVTEVAVIGIEHDTYGEVPKAFVVPDSKIRPTEEEIQQAVSRELSHYKWLRGGVKFVDDLPKTQSMKVNRKLLRSMQ